MGKTKITLDTNVLISAFGWEGNPKRIFNEIINRNIELAFSSEQFDELSRTLDYPKFSFTEEQKRRFKNLILEIAILVKSEEKIEVIKDDPDDNIILESALAGKVNYIITGDSHLLNLKEFKGIKIITVKEFLEKLLRKGLSIEEK